ncbi:MAG: hypothetical protein SNJ78_12365 [Spirochaetales bacterium]
MNQKRIFGMVLVILLIGTSVMSAQTLKGMSLNGATGLISIPTGQIGWERTANLAIDLGYHAVIDDETAHIPKGSVSLFKIAEISFAYDTQFGDDNEDIILGGKIQLPTKGTFVAIGANFQMLKQGGNDDNVTQIYLSATYPGNFFGMPSLTTVVVGKSFGDPIPKSNIDFGMGFDLLLFPKVFQNYIHWITDFANFSYSAQAVGANAFQRGTLNTGIRIDLGSIPQLKKYKFVIDAILTDAMDDNRAFALGLTFGAPLQ